MQKVATRRIQLTGGSTFIVSLPKSWIKELNISSGDEVDIYQDNELKLIIVPRKAINEEEINKAVISCTSTLDIAIREFIAHYMAGYTTVILDCARFPPDVKAILKENIRKRLLGTEIIEESSNSIIVQILVNEKMLSLNKALSREFTITFNMLKDVIDNFLNFDENIVKEVIDRDDEVDRFYFYIARQLTLGITKPEIFEEDGYNLAQIVDIYSVGKYIERIADHSSRIAENLIKIEKLTENETDNLLPLFKRTADIFQKSFKSFINRDKKLAHEVAEEETKLLGDYMIKTQEILPKIIDSTKLVTLSMIIDSFRRITRYSFDIAETAIDLMAKVGSEKGIT
ncbi:MAG: AbrB/MazE/SpoVT family DNA-binding domain-containing protein [Sulfolobaceae archaeon]|nr:AbrB/MazE/SpoVT family DNA-binding domain-containing protein [Sulfolobaceae archaeon]